MFQWVGVESDFGFLALIVSILAVTFLVQFVRTKRFLGLRSQSDSVLRFQSYSALFFVSLLVILNSPLLESSYTGIDSYGLFLFFRKNPKLWAIISNLILNFLLASGATVLFFWIGLEWAKRKPQDVVYSTFFTALFPLGVVYILVALSQKIGLESFILAAFFPLAIAIVAIIGYSHPNNHVDPFTAKFLFVLSIALMVFGFFLAMGGIIFKLYEFGNTKPQNIFETHLWSRTFNWEVLAVPPESFIEKLKLGFTWMVLTASFYLELAVGTAAVMTIYHYQLRPATDRGTGK